MGMRAAQIHKAGALELRPAIRIQRPKPTMKAEIAAFSMFDPTTKPGSIAPMTCYGVKTFGSARAIAPGGVILLALGKGARDRLNGRTEPMKKPAPVVVLKGGNECA